MVYISRAMPTLSLYRTSRMASIIPYTDEQRKFSIPPKQNVGNHSIARPQFGHSLALSAMVLGRGIIRGEELHLVKVGFEGAEASVLLPDEKLINRFPHHEVSDIDVLATEQRRLPRRGARYRHLIAVACYSPYGMCVTPPQWELMTIRDSALRGSHFGTILFSAVVLVEWDDGEQSWETVESTSNECYPTTDIWVGRYLFDLGRKN